MERNDMEGYLTRTVGPGGAWIAQHTTAKPLVNATGRDLMNRSGPIRFAVASTADAALVRLRAELAMQPVPGSHK